MTMKPSSLAAPAIMQPARFDVVLYPNRSLGRVGFAVLMGAIVLVSGGIGAGFMMIGAWPVTGFLGLYVLLRNGVILIEYLSNTRTLTRPRTFLCCLPLKLPGSDGAPARVIAIEGAIEGGDAAAGEQG